MKREETPRQAARRRCLTYIKIEIDDRHLSPHGVSESIETAVVVETADELRRIMRQIAMEMK